MKEVKAEEPDDSSEAAAARGAGADALSMRQHHTPFDSDDGELDLDGHDHASSVGGHRYGYYGDIKDESEDEWPADRARNVVYIDIDAEAEASEGAISDEEEVEGLREGEDEEDEDAKPSPEGSPEAAQEEVLRCGTCKECLADPRWRKVCLRLAEEDEAESRKGARVLKPSDCKRGEQQLDCTGIPEDDWDAQVDEWLAQYEQLSACAITEDLWSPVVEDLADAFFKVAAEDQQASFDSSAGQVAAAGRPHGQAAVREKKRRLPPNRLGQKNVGCRHEENVKAEQGLQELPSKVPRKDWSPDVGDASDTFSDAADLHFEIYADTLGRPEVADSWMAEANPCEESDEDWSLQVEYLARHWFDHLRQASSSSDLGELCTPAEELADEPVVAAIGASVSRPDEGAQEECKEGSAQHQHATERHAGHTQQHSVDYVLERSVNISEKEKKRNLEGAPDQCSGADGLQSVCAENAGVLTLPNTATKQTEQPAAAGKDSGRAMPEDGEVPIDSVKVVWPVCAPSRIEVSGEATSPEPPNHPISPDEVRSDADGDAATDAVGAPLSKAPEAESSAKPQPDQNAMPVTTHQPASQEVPTHPSTPQETDQADEAAAEQVIVIEEEVEEEELEVSEAEDGTEPLKSSPQDARAAAVDEAKPQASQSPIASASTKPEHADAVAVTPEDTPDALPAQVNDDLALTKMETPREAACSNAASVQEHPSAEQPEDALVGEKKEAAPGGDGQEDLEPAQQRSPDGADDRPARVTDRWRIDASAITLKTGKTSLGVVWRRSMNLKDVVQGEKGQDDRSDRSCANNTIVVAVCQRAPDGTKWICADNGRFLPCMVQDQRVCFPVNDATSAPPGVDHKSESAATPSKPDSVVRGADAQLQRMPEGLCPEEQGGTKSSQPPGGAAASEAVAEGAGPVARSAPVSEPDYQVSATSTATDLESDRAASHRMEDQQDTTSIRAKIDPSAHELMDAVAAAQLPESSDAVAQIPEQQQQASEAASCSREAGRNDAFAATILAAEGEPPQPSIGSQVAPKATTAIKESGRRPARRHRRLAASPDERGDDNSPPGVEDLSLLPVALRTPDKKADNHASEAASSAAAPHLGLEDEPQTSPRKRRKRWWDVSSRKSLSLADWPGALQMAELESFSLSSAPPPNVTFGGSSSSRAPLPPDPDTSLPTFHQFVTPIKASSSQSGGGDPAAAGSDGCLVAMPVDSPASKSGRQSWLADSARKRRTLTLARRYMLKPVESAKSSPGDLQDARKQRIEKALQRCRAESSLLTQQEVLKEEPPTQEDGAGREDAGAAGEESSDIDLDVVQDEQPAHGKPIQTELSEDILKAKFEPSHAYGYKGGFLWCWHCASACIVTAKKIHSGLLLPCKGHATKPFTLLTLSRLRGGKMPSKYWSKKYEGKWPLDLNTPPPPGLVIVPDPRPEEACPGTPSPHQVPSTGKHKLDLSHQFGWKRGFLWCWRCGGLMNTTCPIGNSQLMRPCSRPRQNGRLALCRIRQGWVPSYHWDRKHNGEWPAPEGEPAPCGLVIVTDPAQKEEFEAEVAQTEAAAPSLPIDSHREVPLAEQVRQAAGQTQPPSHSPGLAAPQMQLAEEQPAHAPCKDAEAPSQSRKRKATAPSLPKPS
eukprot:TRINITY_DN7934_c0_g1_i1.p1 TRINITY_DN7934_c0_g1~~TRINITY_DN7934_c0_g1_i1.p1  ORF type:complete len:1627 (-),score=343.55 TRINITY_DN7934_c0_g1_i1:505-5385(-)